MHLGGLGFAYKWNMGWMHDMLDYCKQDPVYRKYHHDRITFSLLYAFTENFILPFSHDEVVHGKGSMLNKMPGDDWQKHATLRALYGYMFTHPGKKLLFMGGELAQWREWNHDAELDWELLGEPRHAGMQRWVRDLNRALRRASRRCGRSTSSREGFSWIDCHDHENSVISFIRRGRTADDMTVDGRQLHAAPRASATASACPLGGAYTEVLNSDAEVYGGSNVGNLGASHRDRRTVARLRALDCADGSAAGVPAAEAEPEGAWRARVPMPGCWCRSSALGRRCVECHGCDWCEDTPLIRSRRESDDTAVTEARSTTNENDGQRPAPMHAEAPARTRRTQHP